MADPTDDSRWPDDFGDDTWWGGGLKDRRQDVTDLITVPCAECGTAFAPVSPRNVYCSTTCKNRAWEHRRSPRRRDRGDRINEQPSGGINERCRECGEQLSKPTEGPGRPQIWCSDACRMRAERKAQNGEQIPQPGDRSGDAPTRRRRLIRRWAAEGFSSRQMGERLGMRQATVAQIAREIGVDVPADSVIGRSRLHDANHIVRETTQALEGLALGVSLVDFDGLDPTQARDWATSLAQSISVLSQFTKQVKEMAP